MHETKLILIGGLPGSGKTTLGKKLSNQYGVLRLCTDDEMAELGLDIDDEKLHEIHWKKTWEKAWELLANGESIIFEDGVWFQSERRAILEKAKTLDVKVEFHSFNVPYEELLKRVRLRNVQGGFGVGNISDEQMEKWSKLYETPTQKELETYDTYFRYTR